LGVLFCYTPGRNPKEELVKATLCSLILTAVLCCAQDPLKVAAGQYKLIAENDNVRVLEANLPPGAKTANHSHPALIAVILAPGVTKWTMPDGKTEQSAPDMKRGSALALPAQTHISENVSKTPLRAILVEFKKPAPPAASAKKPSSQATCKVVADSAWATAQLCSGTPGQAGPSHTHAKDSVFVALSDVAAEIDAGGKKRPLAMKKDTAAIFPPETHSVVSKVKSEVVVVDLK
jgi:quercetin dioxygenase-like cupin family protein